MSALRDRFLEAGYAIKLLIHPFNLFPVNHDPERTSPVLCDHRDEYAPRLACRNVANAGT